MEHSCSYTVRNASPSLRLDPACHSGRVHPAPTSDWAFAVATQRGWPRRRKQQHPVFCWISNPFAQTTNKSATSPPSTSASSPPQLVSQVTDSVASTLSSIPIKRFPPWQRASEAAPTPPAPAKHALRVGTHSESSQALGTDVVCVESTSGRRRVYRLRSGVDNGNPWEGFDMVDDLQTPLNRLRNLIASYLLPQGYPDSVAPQYYSYMGWRAVQYFFGGAMSVFTTKSLLGALNITGRGSSEAAAAINWVLKDGAGRLGRFLFARWGRELDCELKQFRLMGDLLMETGAALELSTALMPRAFLPLACTANLAKNLAAVAAHSTRAPIYRTFALSNNLADVTAKGESVANLADVIGTVFGIVLSKARLPLLPTFCVLSAGYLVASRFEVDSVELPYLNRARLAYTAQRFMATGSVPGVPEANHNEPLLPWVGWHNGRVVLGAQVEEACSSPEGLQRAAELFKGKKYALTFREETGRVYVLLREGATGQDVLAAAFGAHLALYVMGVAELGRGDEGGQQLKIPWEGGAAEGEQKGVVQVREVVRRAVAEAGGVGNVEQAMGAVAKVGDRLLEEFSRSAEGAGWKLQSTMLNPKETRLISVGGLS